MIQSIVYHKTLEMSRETEDFFEKAVLVSEYEDLDGFHCGPVLKFHDLAQGEKATLGITEAEAGADGISNAQLFEVDLASVAAKSTVKIGQT
jgi:hypothetical protein